MGLVLLTAELVYLAVYTMLLFLSAQLNAVRW